MRIIVIKEGTNLQDLLGDKAGSVSTLDKLKNLNPHVDFSVGFGNIGPGTVLLIPELPGLRIAESSSVTGEAFDALRDQVLASVDAASTRMRSGFDALLTEQKAVAVVLKSAGLRRALEADPKLKPQINAAAQVFKQDQQQAKAADATLKVLQKQATAELDQLAKMLGGA